MYSVHLASDGAAALTANQVADALTDWREMLADFLACQRDPREIALAAVELEDLLDAALASLDGLKNRARELNA